MLDSAFLYLEWGGGFRRGGWSRGTRVCGNPEKPCLLLGRNTNGGKWVGWGWAALDAEKRSERAGCGKGNHRGLGLGLGRGPRKLLERGGGLFRGPVFDWVGGGGGERGREVVVWFVFFVVVFFRVVRFRVGDQNWVHAQLTLDNGREERLVHPLRIGGRR